MNRFFTLLLAASCLTAVGQEDCHNVLACNYNEQGPCVYPNVGQDCNGDCANSNALTKTKAHSLKRRWASFVSAISIVAD